MIENIFSVRFDVWRIRDLKSKRILIAWLLATYTWFELFNE